MTKIETRAATILGLCLLVGFLGLGWLVGSAALKVKALDRTVVVKGLAEREVPADIAIWPLGFYEANQNLTALYEDIQSKNGIIIAFLTEHGIDPDTVTINPPAVTDRHAQAYGNIDRSQPRYSASSTVTVYSEDVVAVRNAMASAIDLGKRGIALADSGYGSSPEFLFSGLNTIKPEMVEEATRNAREVAEKFAQDSSSRLGKIKSARQGQFSIQNRDSTTPHLKKVRVVSTVQYYLDD